MTMSTTTKDFSKHPCFNADAKGKYGRVHLPVAPKCNIKCNFCDRKYDCVNESRPGVTSSVLTPAQAGLYVDRVLEKEPRITVTGIAGPGDPFANGEETMATMRLLNKQHPEMMLCLSSNGFGIGPYIDEIAKCNVSHVTITICAVDPAIGEKIYSWVKEDNVVYRGRQAAELLLSRQLDAVKRLKAHGITVKVNCIVVPTVNDHHVVEVAKKAAELGADLFNAIALFPVATTPFGNLEQPSKEMINTIRTEAEQYLPQMRHCARCRADAVGLLGDDKSGEFRSCLNECTNISIIQIVPAKERPYVAVASREGLLVNMHLGEAQEFSIWEKTEDGYQEIGTRPAPETGGGIKRWHQLAKILADCRAVLCSGAGDTPIEIMTKAGTPPIEAAGLIEDGLEIVYEKGKVSVLKGRKSPCASGACKGDGMGCG